MFVHTRANTCMHEHVHISQRHISKYKQDLYSEGGEGRGEGGRGMRREDIRQRLTRDSRIGGLNVQLPRNKTWATSA